MAGPRPLTRARNGTDDPATDRVDRDRAEIVEFLRNVPFLRGKLISVKLVASTHKAINHGLGVPAACFPIRFNYDPGMAGPTFAESDSTYQVKLDPKTQLSVVSSGTCSIDLWFYPRASRTVDAVTGQSR